MISNTDKIKGHVECKAVLISSQVKVLCRTSVEYLPSVYYMDFLCQQYHMHQIGLCLFKVYNEHLEVKMFIALWYTCSNICHTTECVIIPYMIDNWNTSLLYVPAI